MNEYTVYRYYDGKFSINLVLEQATRFFAVDGAAVIVLFTETLPSAGGCGVVQFNSIFDKLYYPVT